ncbi:CotS family spore coat protein [Halobacillus sp. A1]|uniref:CotS family spore coat protein n=1 Tax=Halobacillus sp. A1 TaxID=2880262 RepID=UPI0020A67639|nr:CotS family spore coat protein [Halobacillus sp. A1]MCP3029824.1 CotS family spore coat protein [Halobacillus sp. A1]
MIDQIIEPWEEDETLSELYVPEYIENIGLEVAKYYDFTVEKMTVMAIKPEYGGAIWKIDTDKGPFSLKLLHRRPSHSKFSLGAQDYLVHEKKARVPAIIPTRDGEKYVEKGGKLWFVADWIETLHQLPQDLEGTKQLCRALGEFHNLTKGYEPPADADIISRLHRWPRTYERMEKKMNWFRDIVTAYSEMPASATILSVIDMFQRQAQEAINRLENSPYYEIVSSGTKDAGLVHQDYGWSNAQMAEDGVWIIDLDGVSYDITIRDLRKLINQSMHSNGRWDIHWMREMIQAYHEANPISDEVFEMLLIDLSLPNLFYKHIKYMVYSPTTFLNEELELEVQSIIKLEEQKWSVLEELAQDRKGGTPE